MAWTMWKEKCSILTCQQGHTCAPLEEGTFDAQKWFVVGFFVGILWSSQSDDHLENNVGKLGYIIDMKVRKNKIYILLNLIYKSHNLHFKILKFWQIWSLFHEKSFAYVKIKLICSKVGGNVGSL
jgi:hypothetical protein